jgi:hypothetical protein
MESDPLVMVCLLPVPHCFILTPLAPSVGELRYCNRRLIFSGITGGQCLMQTQLHDLIRCLMKI